MPGVLFDFFPEASDKNVNGARSHKRTLLPHRAEELSPGKHAPRCRAMYSSSRNSRTVVTTARPSTRTVMELTSISSSPTWIT